MGPLARDDIRLGRGIYSRGAAEGAEKNMSLRTPHFGYEAAASGSNQVVGATLPLSDGLLVDFSGSPIQRGIASPAKPVLRYEGTAGSRRHLPQVVASPCQSLRYNQAHASAA